MKALEKSTHDDLGLLPQESFQADTPPPPLEDEKLLYTLVKPEFDFHAKFLSADAIKHIVSSFQPLSQVVDENRAECSHKEGGKECKNKKIKECIRSIAKEIVR